MEEALGYRGSQNGPTRSARLQRPGHRTARMLDKVPGTRQHGSPLRKGHYRAWLYALWASYWFRLLPWISPTSIGSINF